MHKDHNRDNQTAPRHAEGQPKLPKRKKNTFSPSRQTAGHKKDKKNKERQKDLENPKIRKKRRRAHNQTTSNTPKITQPETENATFKTDQQPPTASTNKSRTNKTPKRHKAENYKHRLDTKLPKSKRQTTQEPYHNKPHQMRYAKQKILDENDPKTNRHVTRKSSTTKAKNCKLTPNGKDRTAKETGQNASKNKETTKNKAAKLTNEGTRKKAPSKTNHISPNKDDQEMKPSNRYMPEGQEQNKTQLPAHKNEHQNPSQAKAKTRNIRPKDLNNDATSKKKDKTNKGNTHHDWTNAQKKGNNYKNTDRTENLHTTPKKQTEKTTHNLKKATKSNNTHTAKKNKKKHAKETRNHMPRPTTKQNKRNYTPGSTT
ncbi:hypothetical protein [Bacteroides graminisolvens]|uniref:hypothetical protein n=1 Tax=Bacteroides graminisolvens TaxID=477666 RepID=UPI000400D5A5|nr:hypothetical protein [Bacteroides graminisolvens]